MTGEDWTSIGVRVDTRDRIRSMKRGGESYDELVNRIIDQYDPEKAHSSDEV